MNNEKNRLVATAIAFFGGGIGLQWAYLGRTGLAIISFLFFWTTIPSWIALYHVITFLGMSDEKFNKRFNAKV